MLRWGNSFTIKIIPPNCSPQKHNFKIFQLLNTSSLNIALLFATFHLTLFKKFQNICKTYPHLERLWHFSFKGNWQFVVINEKNILCYLPQCAWCRFSPWSLFASCWSSTAGGNIVAFSQLLSQFFSVHYQIFIWNKWAFRVVFIYSVLTFPATCKCILIHSDWNLIIKLSFDLSIIYLLIHYTMSNLLKSCIYSFT
jgi:hypothetical protein